MPGELHMGGMREVHLFAGAGGGILGGILLGNRPVCAVEFNRYCRRVLRRRITDGHLPWFPIFKDVRAFSGKPWRGIADIICAGFPCQPYSTAGKREGEGDDRNLWPDTIRIIREVGPRFAFLENVPGLLAFDYFGQILGDLADAGFDAEWDVVSAASVGAPHLRRRLWILAYAQGVTGREVSGNAGHGPQGRSGSVPGQGSADAGFVADTGSPRRQGQQIQPADVSKTPGRRQANTPGSGGIHQGIPPGEVEGEFTADRIRERGRGTGTAGGYSWWGTEPGVGRVADGVADGVERLRAIGNGQVPLVAAVAFIMLAQRAGMTPGVFGWAEWPKLSLSAGKQWSST